ncbi:long-chain-fatty-acid--CoA ligase [Streptomyces sp. AcE210]|uniref:long-chain-fatty-acid--CoA ligase n=1 Tax=Streptomyces sp. AcE210 TaxID=2292703 RepID=UPI000E304B32|nr:long-chain-fatty-acid--CoA ligase [Streptomyces sp. AcE210]RFC70092.1 long-chain-fatty-acid--CoA ligase [Streptomyces sp. AcE210]
MGLHLPDAVRLHARERGTSAALTCAGSTVSYAELDTRSSRIARALLADADAGSRIGFLARTRNEAGEILVGAAKAGLVNVPLNWRLAPSELTAVARDAELRVLLFEPEFRDAADAVRAAVPGLRLVVVGASADPDVPAYETWLASHPDDDPGRGTAADVDEVFLQIYTSGTTGLPKGVLLTHGNFYADETELEEYLWEAGSVALNALPMFHIGGLGWLRVALTAGANSLLLPEFTPDAAAEAVEREGVTHAFLVPSVLHMLTELPGIERRDFSRLTLITYGSAPITPALLRRSMALFACHFMGKYGLTEGGGTVTQLPPEDHEADGPRRHLLKSVGRPRRGVDVVIADTETGKPVPAGTVGEIRIRSRHNTPGYWNRPAETEALYDADGLLCTGDGGYLDGDGYLFLTDRIKDMIVSGGENVYPAEVESALAEHPAVSEAAVVGVPHEKWGEAVTAVVVLRRGTDAPGEQELIDFTRERIASYKKPHRVHVVEALPRNPNGKVLKRVLRDRLK